MSREPVRPDVGTLSPEVREYIHGLEAVAAARTIAVATNGKFPRWSFERYVMIVGFIITFVTNIFWLGNKVGAVETRVATLESNETAWARKTEMDVEHRSLQLQLDKKSDRVDTR